jgi:hypothetical protein
MYTGLNVYKLQYSFLWMFEDITNFSANFTDAVPIIITGTLIPSNEIGI